MEPEQVKQPGLAGHPVSGEELPALLRQSLRNKTSFRYKPYALIDMGRIQGDLRQQVVKKLEKFNFIPLLDEPGYQQLKAFGVLLIYGPDHDNTDLLDAWGDCNGDIISAWIVSRLSAQRLATHFSQTTHAVDASDTSYLLRYYDPKIIPILHRFADQEWARRFFDPIKVWWHPVATPTHEYWNPIKGHDRLTPLQKKMPLILTDELWDALETDPFPYQALNALEKELPFCFTSDCYGVRLAQIESLLDSGKNEGLKTHDDLFVYARALLENPDRTGQADWQAALRQAVAEEAPLAAYFAPT
jgi:hypothetical protein